ncbi:unnamed protein product [Lampetra fluviatilis]
MSVVWVVSSGRKSLLTDRGEEGEAGRFCSDGGIVREAGQVSVTFCTTPRQAAIAASSAAAASAAAGEEGKAERSVCTSPVSEKAREGGGGCEIRTANLCDNYRR